MVSEYMIMNFEVKSGFLVLILLKIQMWKEGLPSLIPKIPLII